MKITRSQLSQIIMEELSASERTLAIRAIEQFFHELGGGAPDLFKEKWQAVISAMDKLEDVGWSDQPMTRCPIERWDGGRRDYAYQLPRDCEERIEYNQKKSHEALRDHIEAIDTQWDLAMGNDETLMKRLDAQGVNYLGSISTLVDDLIWLPDTDPSARPGNVGSSGMSVSPLRTDPPTKTFQQRISDLPPEAMRERKITPTQFKQLLLEEAGNCTEPQHVIFSIVRDMDPNDVAELFQDVFEQLPGVEMTRLDPEDEEPIPTSYQPGGELGDRPVVGFKEQLMEMIREELMEGPHSS